MSSYSDRRAAALQRIQENAQFDAQQEELGRRRLELLIEAQRKEREAEQLQQEHEARQEAKHWMKDATAGMKMGSALGGSIAGGAGAAWGGLAGAIVGTAKGQREAYQARRQEGQSKWDALTRTHFDFDPKSSGSLDRESLENVGGAVSNWAQAKAIDDARKKRAATAETNRINYSETSGAKEPLYRKEGYYDAESRSWVEPEAANKVIQQRQYGVDQQRTQELQDALRRNRSTVRLTPVKG